jgi:hypothetical protein
MAHAMWMALSDKPEPACEGCRSEAFRPPADATRPGLRVRVTEIGCPAAPPPRSREGSGLKPVTKAHEKAICRLRVALVDESLFGPLVAGQQPGAPLLRPYRPVRQVVSELSSVDRPHQTVAQAQTPPPRFPVPRVSSRGQSHRTVAQLPRLKAEHNGIRAER